MKLPTAAEMKKLDGSATANFGIPSIVLMENAGLGTVLMMERELGSCRNSYALIFVGPGNNGGDGLVIGRHLYQRGCQPVFFLLVNPDSLRGDAAINLQIVKNLKLPFHIVDNPQRVETIPVLCRQFELRGLPCYAVIDAIFGIGLCREVSGHYADCIQLINKPGFAQHAAVVSVDIPSGMDSDTGKTLGACVRADHTATYGCPKPGQFLHGGSQWTGKLEIIDIGIPPEAVYRAGINTELVTADTFAAIARDLERKQDSHKGSHGHLLILAGSEGKTGAAILCGKGALRSGTGLVSLCVPSLLNPTYEMSLFEAMTIALPSAKTYLSIDDWDTIREAAQGKQAIVIGPGIGTQQETAELVLRLYAEASCPLILDADAINLLARHRQDIQHPKGARIFTPHPGELSRLIGKSIQSIQDNRLDAALLGCAMLGTKDQEIVLVLKGAGTIISIDKGPTYINTTGNPGMATGGMGDVLGGVIGALICQGIRPKDAAIAGVFLHSYAADLLYENNKMGYTAGEVADMIPQVFSAICKRTSPSHQTISPSPCLRR